MEAAQRVNGPLRAHQHVTHACQVTFHSADSSLVLLALQDYSLRKVLLYVPLVLLEPTRLPVPLHVYLVLPARTLFSASEPVHTALPAFSLHQVHLSAVHVLLEPLQSEGHRRV